MRCTENASATPSITASSAAACAPRVVAQLGPRQLAQQRRRQGPWHGTAVIAMRLGVDAVERSCSTRSARAAAAASASPAGRPRPARAPARPAARARARRWPGRGCRSARRPGSARGRCTSARAIATRCSWPPDSVLRQARPEALQARPRASIAATRAVVGAAAAAAAAGATLSRDASGAAARGRPGTRSRGGRGATGACVARPAPATDWPSDDDRRRHRHASRPAMQLSSVDLPTPDSPRMATNSPGATRSRHLLEHQRVAVGLGQRADLEHAAIMHAWPTPDAAWRPLPPRGGNASGPAEPDPRCSLGRIGAPAARFRAWPAATATRRGTRRPPAPVAGPAASGSRPRPRFVPPARRSAASPGPSA